MSPDERKQAIHTAGGDLYARGAIDNAIVVEQADTGATRQQAAARIVEWYVTELQAIEARGRTGDAQPDALEVLEQYRYPRVWAIFAARHDVGIPTSPWRPSSTLPSAEEFGVNTSLLVLGYFEKTREVQPVECQFPEGEWYSVRTHANIEAPTYYALLTEISLPAPGE